MVPLVEKSAKTLVDLFDKQANSAQSVDMCGYILSVKMYVLVIYSKCVGCV